MQLWSICSLSVEIVDQPEGLPSGATLRAADFFTTVYMGSSKYFRDYEAIADRYQEVLLTDNSREHRWTITAPDIAAPKDSGQS